MSSKKAIAKKSRSGIHIEDSLPFTTPPLPKERHEGYKKTNIQHTVVKAIPFPSKYLI